GRSLPEYRALRERYDLFDIGRNPELCAEVTLQPVRRHGVDAAGMFADIMTPVLAMGVDVQLVEAVGPVIDPPVTDASQLSVPDEVAPLVCEAIRIVRGELDEEQAVVGFCGGPFTVAGYLVEGKPTREVTKVKAMMYREPETWHALMDKLARTAGCRAASVPRCCSGRGSASRRRRSTCWSARAGGEATSSTSATACCRRPIRTCWAG